MPVTRHSSHFFYYPVDRPNEYLSDVAPLLQQLQTRMQLVGFRVYTSRKYDVDREGSTRRESNALRAVRRVRATSRMEQHATAEANLGQLQDKGPLMQNLLGSWFRSR